MVTTLTPYLRASACCLCWAVLLPLPIPAPAAPTPTAAIFSGLAALSQHFANEWASAIDKCGRLAITLETAPLDSLRFSNVGCKPKTPKEDSNRVDGAPFGIDIPNVGKAQVVVFQPGTAAIYGGIDCFLSVVDTRYASDSPHYKLGDFTFHQDNCIYSGSSIDLTAPPGKIFDIETQEGSLLKSEPGQVVMRWAKRTATSCAKSRDYIWDESYNKQGNGMCTNSCECDGHRECTGGKCTGIGRCPGADKSRIYQPKLLETRGCVNDCDCMAERVCNVGSKKCYTPALDACRSNADCYGGLVCDPDYNGKCANDDEGLVGLPGVCPTKLTLGAGYLRDPKQPALGKFGSNCVQECDCNGVMRCSNRGLMGTCTENCDAKYAVICF